MYFYYAQSAREVPGRALLFSSFYVYRAGSSYLTRVPEKRIKLMSLAIACELFQHTRGERFAD